MPQVLEYVGVVVSNAADKKSYTGFPRTRAQMLEITKAEINAICGRLVGKPIKIEHKPHLEVGKVTHAIVNENGTCSIRFALFNTPLGTATKKCIDNNLMKGLSLTHDLLSLEPEEVSVCFEGARENTWITGLHKTADAAEKTDFKFRNYMHDSTAPIFIQASASFFNNQSKGSLYFPVCNYNNNNNNNNKMQAAQPQQPQQQQQQQPQQQQPQQTPPPQNLQYLPTPDNKQQEIVFTDALGKQYRLYPQTSIAVVEPTQGSNSNPLANPFLQQQQQQQQQQLQQVSASVQSIPQQPPQQQLLDSLAVPNQNQNQIVAPPTTTPTPTPTTQQNGETKPKEQEFSQEEVAEAMKVMYTSPGPIPMRTRHILMETMNSLATKVEEQNKQKEELSKRNEEDDKRRSQAVDVFMDALNAQIGNIYGSEKEHIRNQLRVTASKAVKTPDAEMLMNMMLPIMLSYNNNNNSNNNAVAVSASMPDNQIFSKISRLATSARGTYPVVSNPTTMPMNNGFNLFNTPLYPQRVQASAVLDHQQQQQQQQIPSPATTQLHYMQTQPVNNGWVRKTVKVSDGELAVTPFGGSEIQTPLDSLFADQSTKKQKITE